MSFRPVVMIVVSFAPIWGISLVVIAIALILFLRIPLPIVIKVDPKYELVIIINIIKSGRTPAYMVHIVCILAQVS